MTIQEIDSVLTAVRAALERDDFDAAIRLLDALRAPDQAEILSDLDDDERLALLLKLNPDASADILEEMDDEEVADIVEQSTPEALLPIVQEMEPDEVADLLGDIDPQLAENILSQLDDQEEVRPLLLHPDESAGGLMTSEFLALRRKMTAKEAIEAIRQWKPDTEAVYYLFVIDGQDRLCGVVGLRDLIIADPNTRLEDIMDPDVISVPVGTDQEACAQLMSKYDLLALPVVDAENKLLGVITVDDLVDVLVDEATEDIQRFGGAEPLKESYLNTSVFTVAQKRIGWLMLLFVTGSLTGTILKYFEDQLQAVVALTYFIPLLIGTGGNAGSQTTSTIIRAIALGDIDWEDGLKTIWHEMRAGLLLGVGIGVVGYLRAYFWGVSPDVAYAVAAALLCIVIWANTIGSLLPLVAERLHIDPTLISGPVMSTLVDTTGLIIYMTVARIFLGL